jgi:catechol 2,3-dioxygenase-like lactoylglutathione lyase family enzyme
MNILDLELLTDDIEGTEVFYTHNLGLNIVSKGKDYISFSAGQTTLMFIKSENVKPVYHFAFNIPNNQLGNAVKWSSSKLLLLEIEENNCIVNFDSWNAKSVYFYDNNGNILEFIARFDLDNASNTAFSSNSIVSISEIGLVSPEPVTIGKQMMQDYNLDYFEKGAKSKQFATLGDDNGLLIIVENKRKWYPTQIEAASYLTKVRIEVGGIESEILFNS